LEILKARGFDTDDWGGFSVTEIQTLYNNKQLDMLLENQKNKRVSKTNYSSREPFTRLCHHHCAETKSVQICAADNFF
jgi:hypothetical protein